MSSGATVIGNFIGLDATGDTVLQNGYSGIDITGSNNIIGGTTAASRNVISGNHNANILLNAGSSHNQVLGNYIGTNASDWIVLANDIDIMIQDGSSYNTIGGTTAAAANVIANAGVGVEITGSPSRRRRAHPQHGRGQLHRHKRRGHENGQRRWRRNRNRRHVGSARSQPDRWLGCRGPQHDRVQRHRNRRAGWQRRGHPRQFDLLQHGARNLAGVGRGQRWPGLRRR